MPKEINIYTYYFCFGLLLNKLANNGYIIIQDSNEDTNSIDDVDLLPSDSNNNNDNTDNENNEDSIINDNCVEIENEYSKYTKDYSYFLSEEKYTSIFRKNLCNENDFCYERDIKIIANVIHYFYSIIKNIYCKVF